MAFLSAKEIVNLLLGAFAVACFGSYVTVMHKFVKPTEGNFFCTDPNINYTSGYLEDIETVSMVVAGTIGTAIVLVTVVVVETVRAFAGAATADPDPVDAQYAACLCCCCATSKCLLAGIKMVRNLILGLVGGLITESITVTLKKAIGRKRPYFLSVCDMTVSVKELCYAGKLTSVTECQRKTPQVEKHLLEAIQSFPSGHSSHSMYLTVFAALYLQSRFPFNSGHQVKWLVQVFYLLWGVYVCGTRVSDYRHHWGDVVAGGLGGIVIGLLVCLQLRPSYLAKCAGSQRELPEDDDGNQEA